MTSDHPHSTASTWRYICQSGIKIRCLSISRSSQILRLPSAKALQALALATQVAQAQNHPKSASPTDLNYTCSIAGLG